MVAVVEHDLVVAQLAAQLDQLGRRARDPRDLLVRLGGLRRAVDPDDAPLRAPARRSRRSSPPGCCRSPSRRRSCRRRRRARAPARPTSCAQRAKPSPPSRWSDAPAGIAYGLPPRASTSASACSQLSLKPMPKPALTSRTSAPMRPAELDVADAVVDDVRPVHPALLDQHAARGRCARPRRPPAGCGWTGRRRSRRACRSPWRARRRRGTRACASCCRRRRGRCCSHPASPTAGRRRGAS